MVHIKLCKRTLQGLTLESLGPWKRRTCCVMAGIVDGSVSGGKESLGGQGCNGESSLRQVPTEADMPSF